MNFNYCQTTELVFGRGRTAELGQIAKRFGNKTLLVTVKEFPAVRKQYAQVKKILAKAGVKVTHYDGVVPNPTVASIDAGAKLARACGAQSVIGLGGGSSMDSAKAIAVAATHPGSCWDYLFYKKAPTAKTLPIIAVTTTSGTGSQVTQVAVITNPKTRDKSAIHPNTSPMTDMMAWEAINLVVKWLPKALADGTNLDAREAMALADTLGGYSIAAAGVTLPHGMGMAIGGMYPHVAHGEALAIVYPAFVGFTWRNAVPQFARLARILNPALVRKNDRVAASKCEELVAAFLKKIGMRLTLKGMNVPVAELPALAKQCLVLPDYKGNPRVTSPAEMLKLVKESYSVKRK